jgi:hypothetical protein
MLTEISNKDRDQNRLRTEKAAASAPAKNAKADPAPLTQEAAQADEGFALVSNKKKRKY